MSKPFLNKVVIVTGSSNGIGRTTARLFAKEGAKVTLTGRSASALEEARQELLAEGSDDSQILVLSGDLTDSKFSQELIDKTLAKWGKLDILINNAGAASSDSAPVKGFETPLEYYDYTVNLNTRAILVLTQLALPHLIKAKGEIVNISSIAGLAFAQTQTPYYAMAKAALDSMTRSLAIAYIGQGVRVNGINPGLVATKFIEKMGANKEQAEALRAQFEADPNKLPVGRQGQPEDIAEAILFLADRKKSGFIVGQNIVIDGGTSLVLAANATDFKQAFTSPK